MIRIIQAGDMNLLKETLRFDCPYCNCIFEADKGDYTKEGNNKNEFYAYCICPTCSKTVYVSLDY